MDADALHTQRDEVLVLDVREADEWDAGHIDGAVFVPMDELDDRLDDLDESRPVVTVCRSGSRSADAARMLSRNGFEAQNLDGGLQAWAAAGLPLVDNDGEPGTVAGSDTPADDANEEHQRLGVDYVNLALQVQEHFGDREPSEDEIRAYLRDLLIQEGKSPEEADQTMARITESQGP